MDFRNIRKIVRFFPVAHYDDVVVMYFYLSAPESQSVSASDIARGSDTNTPYSL